jgi:hypothetical protein
LRNDFIEQSLSQEMAAEIRDLAIKAAARLRLATAEPERVARAIAEYVEDNRPPEGDRIVEEAVELGVLWAEQLLRITGWEWVELRETNTNTQYAIVSRDRALVLFPTALFLELLGDTDRDNTTLLLFNMIRCGNVPEAEPGEYQVIS